MIFRVYLNFVFAFSWTYYIGSGSRLPLLGALADFSPSVRDRVEAHSDLVFVFIFFLPLILTVVSKVSYFSPRRIWHVKHVRQHAARVFAPLIQNRYVLLTRPL